MVGAKPIVVKNGLDRRTASAAVTRGLDKTAEATERRLARDTRRWRTPVTFYTTDDNYKRHVGTNSDLYLFADRGTKKHKIRARRRRNLVFFSRGRWNYVKEVNHPGTKAKGWTKTVAVEMTRVLQKNIQQELDEVANG